MKIIGRIPSTRAGKPTLTCDLCGTTEVQPLTKPKGGATHRLIPMFKGEDVDNEGGGGHCLTYTLCANCANKEAEVA